MALGRPTKLTTELTEQLCVLLEQEWFMAHACAEVGVSDRVVYLWLEQGQKEGASEEHAAFFQACARARSKGERAILERMEEMAKAKKEQDWKVLSWKLERLRGELYHLSAKTELSGPGGKPIEVLSKPADITQLSTEDVRALARGEQPGSRSS